MRGAKKPVAGAAFNVGDKVWLGERGERGTFEHVATVTAVHGDALDLAVVYAGDERSFSGVKPWGPDSKLGWWKAHAKN